MKTSKNCGPTLFRRFIGAALFTAGAVAPTANAQWTVVNLHPAGATSSVAYGVSDGLQVGYAYWANAAHRAILWSGTASSWMDLNPAGTTGSEGYSASPGQQVGYATLAEGGGRASLWSGSSVSWVNLHPAAATSSVARAVGGDRQAGHVTITNVDRASVWSGTAASWVDIHPTGTEGSYANGCDGEQQVGYVRIGGNPRASLWRSSAESWVELTPAGALTSVALGVHSQQQVGTAYFGSQYHAGLWTGTAASWVDLNPIAATSSTAYSVYGGQQVGSAVVSGMPHASFWRSTAASWVDLHLFVPSEFGSSQALGIWNDGAFTYVVGSGYNNATALDQALMWVMPCESVSFSMHPSSAAFVPGHTASFSVSVIGSATSFRWRHNTIPLTDGPRLSGSATATLTIGSVQASDEGAYDCVVSSACNTVTSNAAMLSCDPILLTQPPPRSLLRPDLQLAITVPPGAPYTYRWRQNGQNLFNIPGLFSGVTTRTLTLLAVDASLAGSYDCVVTDACGVTASNVAAVFCPADFDDGSGTGTPDGGVTIDDLLYYLYIFDAGLLASDIDDGSGMGVRDGGVTIDDLLYYLQRFDAGC